MTPLQEKILGVMNALDLVCRENGLQYYMLGGTMLGAVRHGGFIPWDDDADFGLPRADYEKLLRLPEERFPKGFRLRHFSKEKEVPYAFARLEDEGTTCIESRRCGSGYVGGVYVDIFPLDDDSHSLILQWIKERKIRIYKKLLYAHIAGPGRTKNPVKSGIMELAVRLTKQEKLVRRLDGAVSCASKKKNVREKDRERYSNYLGHWGRRESVPVQIFKEKEGGTAYYSFERKQFPGPADSESYLSALYGEDFMMLPEESKREGHPTTVTELDKSYHCYENKYGNKESGGDKK